MAAPQSDRNDAGAPAGRSMLDELRASSDGVRRLAQELLPGGKFEAGESRWHAGDATGAKGRSLSVALSGSESGLWHDAATGDGGDLIGLLIDREGGADRARAWLEDRGYLQRRRRTVADIKDSAIAPDDAPPPAARSRLRIDGEDREVSTVGCWAYRLADGRRVGYVVRFAPLDGGDKVIRPMRWQARGERRGYWRLGGLPDPRPLYRLPELLAVPGAPVLVCEGEKTADRAAAMFPDFAVVTSAGGAAAAGKSDWSALKGRDVWLLPDADHPDPQKLDRALDGERYAAAVHSLAHGAGAASVRRLPPTEVARLVGVALPDGDRGIDAAVPAPPFDAADRPYGSLPDGWDVGDVGDDAGPIALADLQALALDALSAPAPAPSAPDRSKSAASRADYWRAVESATARLSDLGYVHWMDDRFWRRNGSAVWERVNRQSVTEDLLGALDAAGAEVRPKDGVWLGRGAAAEVRLRWEVGATPASVSLLPESDLLRPHNLDTGALVTGAAFANCTLSVGRDGSISTRQLDARDFIRWALPYDWCGVLDAPPPRFAEFLRQTFDGASDAADRSLLLCELIGYTLSGDRGAQVVPVLVGGGGSGKGVALRLVGLLLGGDAQIASAGAPQRLAGRFSGTELVGKAALVLEDLPLPPAARAASQYSDFLAGLGVIKAISGGDLLPVERKGGDTVSMRIPAVVWGASNFSLRWLQGAEDVSAWRRRLRLVGFDNERPEDERIADYESVVLGGELAQIAAYCIGRYAAAVKRSAGRGVAWTAPASSAAMLAEMLRGVAGKGVEFCESNVRRNPSGWLSRDELRAGVAQAHYGGDADSIPRGEMSAAFQWCGLQVGAREAQPKLDGKRVRGWRGLVLGGDAEQAAFDAPAGGDGTGDVRCERCGDLVAADDLMLDAGDGCKRCAGGGGM